MTSTPTPSCSCTPRARTPRRLLRTGRGGGDQANVGSRRVGRGRVVQTSQVESPRLQQQGLQGVYTGSTGGLQGVYRGSSGGLQGVYTGSTRGLKGVYRGSAGGLHGVYTGSTRGLQKLGALPGMDGGTWTLVRIAPGVSARPNSAASSSGKSASGAGGAHRRACPEATPSAELGGQAGGGRGPAQACDHNTVGGFAEVEVAWQAVRKGVAAVRFRGRSLVYEVSQTLLLAVHPPDLRLPLVPAFVPAHPTEAAPPLRPLRGRCECYFCSPLRFLHLVSPRVVTGAVA
eukprot:1189431-Prorocentrum_minimum.AAC.2